jgi:hypothetical protein
LGGDDFDCLKFDVCFYRTQLAFDVRLVT